MLTRDILENSELISFHTPSHAGNLNKETLLCDVTELFYSDNLLSPQGAIKDLETYIASAYNAEACFISTQGATHNIFQAIFATYENGAFLTVGKCHASVYNALRLFKAKTYHVDNLDDNTVLPKCVKTVIITSPDYFGNVINLEKISLKLKKENVSLIVDASHGSHFAFSNELPVSAVEYADLVIHSLHKTLHVITGGSVLLCKERFAEKAFLCRKLLHTTSPSYMVICSVENAVKEFVFNGEKYYRQIKTETDKLKADIKPPFEIVSNDDFTRLVIKSPYDGKAVYNELVRNGICAEFYYENKVVLIINPYNYTYLKKVTKAVNAVKELPLYLKTAFPQKAHPNPTLIYFGESFESVPLTEAEGRRAYMEIGFYPPGVPLIYAGDEIKKEHVEVLREKSQNGEVFGLDKNRAYVLK